MSERDRLNRMLAQIGASHGLSEFALDADGYCALAYRGYEVVLQVTPDDRWLSLHVKLAPAPEEPAERLSQFESMLMLNHLGLKTEGLVFSLDADRSVVALHYNYPANAVADAEALQNLLNFFLRAMDRIEDKMRNLANQTDEPHETPSGEPEFMIRA